MIVTIPSGSQMDRIARCPASAALPQIHSIDENPDRDRGTAMHKFLERVPEVGREAALAEADERHRGLLADIDLAKLADRLTLSREFALAYNWRTDTARALQPLQHRAYDVDPSCEIPATLDLAGAGDRIVFVGDYKGPHGWLPEPEQSMQLGLGALALARLHRASRAQLEYIRVRDDGTLRKFHAGLDVFGLEAAAARIAGAMAEVDELRPRIAAGEVPTVVEGPHCRYCPASQFCPAKTARMRALLANPQQPIPYTLPITPENAQHVYELLRQAKQVLAQVEGAVYAYGKTTPIPLGQDEDGSLRFFGEHRRPGNDRLDGAIVHQVLAELYGGAAANAAVTMEATKKAVTDAVRKALPAGEKVTAHVKAVLDLVDQRGGITNPETVSTTEFTVSPDGTAKARKRKAG